jgi:hypothetical protein
MRMCVCLLVLLAAIASGTGCSKEKPPPNIPSDGLKGVTPKSQSAPKPP